MSRHDTLLRLVFASVRDTRRKPVAFSRARGNTRIPARYRRHAVRCGAVRCGAMRCGATTAPSNGAIHVVPKRPSLLRVYDPFYVRPPARPLLAAYPAPLFTDREGKQPSSVTCYCSYANRLHSWSNVVHAHTRAGTLIRKCSRYRDAPRAGVRGRPFLQKHSR